MRRWPVSRLSLTDSAAMPIAHLAAALLAAAPSTDGADHVLRRLPLAPPAGAPFAGLVRGPDGASALVTGAGSAYLDVAVDGGALEGRVGPSGWLGAVDPRDGAALDPDGDGVESWWTVDGPDLAEVVRGLDGAPVLGTRVALPAGAATLTVDGLVVVGELVGAVVAEPGAAPEFRPLWAGPRRAVARVRGAAPAACAVAPDGSVWFVTPQGATPVAIAEPARDLRVRALEDGALELIYRAESGALRRAELDRTVDGALTGVDLALAVEADTIDLAHAWLVDVDADGDADLVANEDGRVVVRRGWGTSGFLAPRAVLAGEALDVRIVAGVAVAVLPGAVARLDAEAARVQDAPLDAAIANASDVDDDGDVDLHCGSFVGVNDGAGTYTWSEVDEPAMRLVFEDNGAPATWRVDLRTPSSDVDAIEIDFESDALAITERLAGKAVLTARFDCARESRSNLSFGGADPLSFLVETRPGVVRLLVRSSEGWTLGAPRVAPAGARLVDVDQDGDDDLVAVADGALLTWYGPEHRAPDGGAFLQFGAGEAGTDGVVPLLGASGPVRLSDEPGRVHLVRAAPDSDLFVAVTPDATLLDQRLFPATFVVDRTQLVWLQGRTDARGRWDFPLDFDPTLVGRTLFGQAFVLDAGAVGGISASNRLAVTYGR